MATNWLAVNDGVLMTVVTKIGSNLCQCFKCVDREIAALRRQSATLLSAMKDETGRPASAAADIVQS
jgi:hypothetical protein